MKYYYFVISLFVLSISILYKTIDAAIFRTSSTGKIKSINRTRKPQSKPQFKKPEPSKSPKKNDKKNERNENKDSKKDNKESKAHETNKNENENKSDPNKKEMNNDKKETHPHTNNNNNINQKEDASKIQTNMIQNPPQNNNLPAANTPQVENKENSGILNGIISSIGGNIIGNAISDKLFKSDKHQKNETYENEKDFHEPKHQRQMFSSNNNMVYDYYIFAIQNKEIFCLPNKSKNSNCKKDDSVRWTIHGLWPNSLNGNHPLYCSNKENNPDLFSKELQKNLNKYWPSLISNNNNDFWDHQWKKHGTCGDFTELKNNTKFSSMDDNVLYFEKSLEIYNRLNIANLFNHKNYFNTFEDLTKMIKNRLNTNNFDAVCSYNKGEKKQYIKEFRFKFDKNWGLSIDENLKQNTNCLKKKPVFIYPEINLSTSSSTYITKNYFYLSLLLITSLLFE